VSSLVPADQPLEHDVDGLRSRLSVLEAALNQRVTELERTKTDLDSFRVRYRTEVGHLHEQLDDLERAIDEAELGEINKRLETNGNDPVGPVESQGDQLPRFTSDAIRRLFRDVAKIIHPDVDLDEATRDRRHMLMVEANRAYALKDEERLRWILRAWENSPEAVQGDDPESSRLRLVRRIAQAEEELNVRASELAALRDTPLWKLKTMVDEAAARGKDLVRDMVRRLERDILVARNRLDAMQWRP